MRSKRNVTFTSFFHRLLRLGQNLRTLANNGNVVLFIKKLFYVSKKTSQSPNVELTSELYKVGKYSEIKDNVKSTK